MINYERKMRLMLMLQKREGDNGWETYCPISDLSILPVKRTDPATENVYFIDLQSNDKIDFCHGLSNTKHNRKKYPHFIDSIMNGCAGLHSCHLSSLYPNYPDYLNRTDREIFLLNDFLSGYDNNAQWRRGWEERAFLSKVVNGFLNVSDLALKRYYVQIIDDVKEKIIQEGK